LKEAKQPDLKGQPRANLYILRTTWTKLIGAGIAVASEKYKLILMVYKNSMESLIN